MTLINQDKLQEYLCCPICHRDLRSAERSYICQADHVFPNVGAHPVLVDFDRSVLKQDIFVESVGSSEVERGGDKGVRGWIRNALFPSNGRTITNAKRFSELLAANKENPRILIIGGGAIGAGTDIFYTSPNFSTVSIDIYCSVNSQVVADAHHLPFKNEVFDGVWIQAVLEHVLCPQDVVAEISRVLKKDGIVYSETPFLQQVHEGAYDFTRFTDSGHRWLFRSFDVLSSGALSGTGTQFLWSIEFLVRGLFRSRMLGKAAKISLFWVRFADNLIPEEYNIDSASSFFLLGRKSGDNVSPRQLIEYYRGAQ